MEQETSLQPFYCTYDFTCSISSHAQTLNKYLDAKNTFEYQNNKRLFEWSEYLLQPYYQPQQTVSNNDMKVYCISLYTDTKSLM